jgi:hypothetical protein
MQGFTTAVTDIDTAPQEYLGAIRFDYNAAWKYVRFAGTVAAAVGDVVTYVLSDQTMTTVDVAVGAVGAGVVPVAHPAGSVTYGWVQIRGVVTLSTAFGAGAAGNGLTSVGAAIRAVTVAAAVTNVGVGFIVNVTAPIVMYAMFPD